APGLAACVPGGPTPPSPAFRHWSRRCRAAANTLGPMTSEAGGAMPSRRLELVPADELKAALADGVRAQHEVGDLQASRDNFERAYRLADQAGDVESMALAALGLAGLWVAERRTV